MSDREIDAIVAWLVAGGLDGLAEAELLSGFCERCVAAGLPVVRALVLIDTLHPIHEGRAFKWWLRGGAAAETIEYGRTDRGDEATADWQRSASHHLLVSGLDELRNCLACGGQTAFTELDDMREELPTDHLAMRHRFAADGTIGEMDCFYAHWFTMRPAGFTEDDVAALRRLAPPLALAIKVVSLTRIAATLAEVYLGQDAGRRVLQGRILRGVTDRIHAVLWFSDLRGYTAITDTAPPDEIIPLLNDYAEAVISAIHQAGGDVLKLIGDGTLAIFKADDPADACRAALRAEADLRCRLQLLDARRREEGRPVTSPYLGLHVGEVFYGNIGSEDRLDFTVVGPAVNEVARIASMCRSTDRPVLFSSEFVAALAPEEQADLVSVGRFALRGVGRPRELFTLDPLAVAATLRETEG